MPYVVLPWLAEHVDLAPSTSAQEVAAALVRVGLEEEAIHSSGVTGPLRVGVVLEVTPEAQKNGKVVNWCQVDTGERDADGAVVPRGVICGAHNFGVGDTVVVAVPGAVLPGDFVIAARKTYGHVSDGMICSAAELGLAADPRYANDGIIVLATAAERADGGAQFPEPGADARELLGLAEETLEINVTPDRGYCFSMRGVAREYHHATGAAFTDPGLPAPAGSAPEVPAVTADPFTVLLADSEPIRGIPGCDRFVTRIVRGIDPLAASPDWLRRRLRQAGMRPISLAVDATNYVMLDLGQPLHAYDLDLVHEPIVVRRAAPEEHLETLDGVDRALHTEDLLITDSPDANGARVIGIAGVMGGASTEVSETTTDVLIEAAHFDPVTIARSARRHKLPSEASRRFERGVDTALQAIAAQRVVDLLVRYGGGVADETRVGDVDETGHPAPIALAPSFVTARVGVAYTDEDVLEALTELGASVTDILVDSAQGDPQREFVVTPPTWRSDLTTTVDLVEEVVRLRGYDQVPSVLPRAQAGRGLTRQQRLRRAVERTLAEAGLVQVLSYPFVAATVHDALGEDPRDARREAERLANPLAEDAPELRTSVLATLLPVAARNLARGASTAAVFETGSVTFLAPGLPGLLPPGGSYPGDDLVEKIRQAVPPQARHVAAVLGSTTAQGTSSAQAETVIAIVARLAGSIGVAVSISGTPIEEPRAPFHPGRCARVTTSAGEVLGYAGELAPTVASAFSLPPRTAAFELDLDALVEAAGDGALAGGIGKLSTFPAAKEDFAFVVAKDVAAQDVRQTIEQAAGELAESVELFDVYTGAQVGDGKSLAFALRLRSAQHTLTAADTQAVRDAVVRLVGERHGGELRA